jgi:site-specific DNA-methyltransferase (adenine-specific)
MQQKPNNYLLIQANCLDYLKTLPDNCIELILTDPPYALGSKVHINKATGKPDYKRKADFMDKWEQPDGAFWEEWFAETNRVLKYGGRVLMFGLDRQLFFYEYYANMADFTQQQSLYWYSISGFPKATDLVSQLTKNKPTATPLAQKYDGMKYSIAPLKQVCETIMVFQKAYKTGSCLHDTIAYENGDRECFCAALNIENNAYGDFSMVEPKNYQAEGRYPAQAFVDSEAAKVLDAQSGVQKSSGNKNTMQQWTGKIMDDSSKTNPRVVNEQQYAADTGGCSRILHTCDYDKGEHDLFMYCPKVAKKERNMGCEDFEEVQHHAFQTGNGSSGKPSTLNEDRNTLYKNTHPTVKPIKLLRRLLELFKPPDDITVLDCFIGSGSTGIAAAQVPGVHFVGVELNDEYFKIAQARVSAAHK